MTAILEPDLDLDDPSGGDADDETCLARVDGQLCGQPVEWELLVACATDTHIARLCDHCRRDVDAGRFRCSHRVTVQVLCAVRTRP